MRHIVILALIGMTLRRTDMKEVLNWGVLGYAGIARKHVLPAMLQCKEAKLYAIASRHTDKLEQAVQAFGFEKTYSSYDELLKDPNVDAVYIPLPNELHKEWVIKAAECKKNILCEKPLSLSAESCREMIEEARKHDIFLMEAFMYRFTNRTRKLQQLLSSHVIGDIKTIKSSYRFCMESFDTDNIRLNKDLAGGALHDVGCYPVNIIGMITGSAPIKIKALQNSYRGVDISLSAILEYENGIIASIDCGFDSQSCLLTEIAGTTGSIIMRDTFLDTDAPIITVEKSSGTLTKYEISKSERYEDEINAVTTAILKGKKELLPLEESIRNNQIIADILTAAKD